MKIITFEEIKKLNINPNLWFEWAEHVLQNKHNYLMPAKTCMHFEDGRYFNTMPSLIEEKNVMGVKVVNRILGRVPSLASHLLLYDFTTGNLKAMMDASLITAMRTAASAVHAIDLYAVKDFKEIGVMGFGNIGTGTLDVLCEHYKDRELHIKLLRYKNRAEEIIERFKDYTNIKFDIVDTREELIKNSDVVISAITYTEDLIGEEDWFKPGCLVIPVHLRGFQNLDKVFDKVFGDDRAQVSSFQYFNEFKSFAETNEVLNGKKPGRENDEERIIVYYVGLSLHDVYAASMIYDLFESKPEESIIMEPKEKTWM